MSLFIKDGKTFLLAGLVGAGENLIAYISRLWCLHIYLGYGRHAYIDLRNV